MKDKLTIKQEIFVNGLIKGKSQREAYKAAYPKSKTWLPKSIDQAASRLFSNSKVQTRYNEIKSRIIKELEQETIIDTKKIIRELKNIAFDDIGNYLDFKTIKVVSGVDEDNKPIFEYKIIIDLKDSTKIDTKNIQEISLAANGAFRFKMYDRLAALSKLADLMAISEMQRAKLKLEEDRLTQKKENEAFENW